MGDNDYRVPYSPQVSRGRPRVRTEGTQTVPSIIRPGRPGSRQKSPDPKIHRPDPYPTGVLVEEEGGEEVGGLRYPLKGISGTGVDPGSGAQWHPFRCDTFLRSPSPRGSYVSYSRGSLGGLAPVVPVPYRPPHLWYLSRGSTTVGRASLSRTGPDRRCVVWTETVVDPEGLDLPYSLNPVLWNRCLFLFTADGTLRLVRLCHGGFRQGTT